MSSKNPSDPKPSNDNKGPSNLNADHIISFVKTHSRESIAYVLLVLGIVLLLFDNIYGGILVGIVTGIYFGDNLVNYIVNWKLSLDSKDMTQNIVLAGASVAFLITSPAIFLGIAISIAVKQLFVSKG